MATKESTVASLQHEGDLTLSLGCKVCPFLADCGGLRVTAGVFDCLRFCPRCEPKRCDLVCPRAPRRFVARCAEVGGFALSALPRFPQKDAALGLPGAVPLLYGASGRKGPLICGAVAVPLYRLNYHLSGMPRFVTRESLADSFRFANSAALVLSGTDCDQSIERWWGIRDKGPLFDALINLQPAIVTSPNYSLPLNVPRHDNLHSIKRIGTSCVELGSAGIPVALHVNARTDNDWTTWTHFIGDRPEISFVAFEFATGGRTLQRRAWYVEKLLRLRSEAGRPLGLVVRGGLEALRELAVAFESLTYIDTDSYVRTMKRRRFDSLVGEWVPASTRPGELLDNLLACNVCEMARYVERLTDQRLPTNYVYHEPWQPSLLNESSPIERGTQSSNRQ